MILRSYRALVVAGEEGHYHEALRRLIAQLRQTLGIVDVKVGRRIRRDGRLEVMWITQWADWDSLVAWVGPDLTRPRLAEDLADVLERHRVVNWEAVAEDARGT